MSNCLTQMNTRRCGLVIALSLGGLAAVADANEYVLDLTKPKDASPFFHISRAGKFGFMDARGNIVIQPRFDDEGYFFGGLARVKVGTLWGFTNQAGKIVIAPRFEAVGDFSEALAPVRVGRKWGYIDQNGRMLIAPAFQGAATFREGLARVETWNAVRCGREKVHANKDAPAYAFYIHSDFDDLMREVCLPVDSKFGYIDHIGQLVITPRFARAHDFIDGLALVRIDSTESGKYGFIDRTGALAIGFQFDEAHDFSEGLAVVLVGRRKVNGIRDPGSYGFIDRLGKFVIGTSLLRQVISPKESRPWHFGIAKVGATSTSLVDLRFRLSTTQLNRFPTGSLKRVLRLKLRRGGVYISITRPGSL